MACKIRPIPWPLWLLLTLAAVLMAVGCSGVRCTRTVRWLVNDDGTRSVMTEWQEEYPEGKFPEGWRPDSAMDFRSRP